MLAELIEFVDGVLPNVDSSTKNKAKDAILQFEKNGEKIKYMMLNPLKQLSQGDIISNVPFIFFEANGAQKVFKSDALVISTSCHIDQKNDIVMVPVLSLEEFNGNITELKRNTIYDYMYIPDGYMSDKFIDFSVMNTYDKKMIFKGLEIGKQERIGSLNQMGYYLFIIKLTVYLMRKEDSDTLNERNIGFAY